MTTATQGVQGTKTNNTTGVGSNHSGNLSKDGVLREGLSAADVQARDGLTVDQGKDALLDSSGVKLATMTPSAFWASKLGECHSKGISPANCTPWS